MEEFAKQGLDCYRFSPVGFVQRDDTSVGIHTLSEFRSALHELETFRHVQVLWWFSKFEDTKSRQTTQFDQMPFTWPPLAMFSCRSPIQPNPLGLTTTKIIGVEHENGLGKIADIDVYDGTPVLDLKAYIPHCDRVKEVQVPD